MSAGGVNKVILIGNLGKDPEVVEVGENKVCKFSLATNDKWKDKSGTLQEKTEWHNVVAWGPKGEIIKQYAKKGSRLFIEGRIQTRSWEDQKTGTTRYMTEIVCNDFMFLDRKETTSEGGQGGGPRDDLDIPY